MKTLDLYKEIQIAKDAAKAAGKFLEVNKKDLNAEIITPVFKDEKNGTLKIISFYAKKARGMMTRFIIQNRIKNIDEIKKFNLGGYVFSESLTNSKEWVFTR